MINTAFLVAVVLVVKMVRMVVVGGGGHSIEGTIATTGRASDELEVECEEEKKEKGECKCKCVFVFAVLVAFVIIASKLIAQAYFDSSISPSIVHIHLKLAHPRASYSIGSDDAFFCWRLTG